MTPERLSHLISLGESLGVEFKGEQTRPLSDSDLVKAVVCLANRPDSKLGWLLIGIEDDGRVVGARPRHEGGKTDPRRVEALVANRTRPSLSCRAELIRIEDREILAIEVPAAPTPVATSDGLYLRRAVGHRGEPECRPYHFHEMQARQASHGVLDHSAMVIPEADWDDIDRLEIERFRRSVREARGLGDASLLSLSDLDLAKALGAISGDHAAKEIRILGLLMFGKEEALRRLLPTHEVAFQVLSGTNVEVNDFLRWPLLRTMEELLGRFRARNREEEISVGLLRIGVPSYSERAFREALANALIHRDYTRTGAVHVQWRSDRIEISNPGGFPEGVTLDNVLVTPPRPRNPRLADAFKRAGVVERTARGVDTIFFEQLRNGRPAPSYQRSSSTDVVLDIPGGEANLNFVRLLVEEAQKGVSLDLDALLILNALWQERTLATREATRLIQKPEAEARARLQRLVEDGFCEARGDGRGRTYHLSSNVYQRLGEEAAYVRQKGFDTLQQEQMVLQYAEAHGRITRREAADLCRLGSDQASRLLRKLAGAGKLVMHGKKRGAWYEPAHPQ